MDRVLYFVFQHMHALGGVKSGLLHSLRDGYIESER
jgi:hypothetical protein